MKYRPSSALRVTYCSTFASSGLTRPSDEPLLATALYLAANDTFRVSAVTIGRNFSPSGARVLAAKKSVTEVSLPRTIHDEIEGVSVVEIDQGFGVSDNSKPLAGSHVLVVAGGREMRSLIKESIRHMGLLVDFVNSVEEAEEFCRDALPHAIIYESVLANDRFHRLHVGISSEMPTFVFIEVTPEGNALQLSTGNNDNGARIGREAVMQSLPSALIFELSRTL